MSLIEIFLKCCKHADFCRYALCVLMDCRYMKKVRKIKWQKPVLECFEELNLLSAATNCNYTGSSANHNCKGSGSLARHKCESGGSRY